MWKFEDYQEMSNCTVCGKSIDQSGMCVPCGRKLEMPCGTTKKIIQMASNEELDRLSEWIKKEKERRGG